MATEKQKLIYFLFPEIFPRVLIEDSIYQQTLNYRDEYKSKIAELENLKENTINSLADFSSYDDPSSDIDNVFDSIQGIDNEILFYTSKVNRLERDQPKAELAAVQRRIDAEQAELEELVEIANNAAVSDAMIKEINANIGTYGDIAARAIYEKVREAQSANVNAGTKSAFLNKLQKALEKLESEAAHG